MHTRKLVRLMYVCECCGILWKHVFANKIMKFHSSSCRILTINFSYRELLGLFNVVPCKFLSIGRKKVTRKSPKYSFFEKIVNRWQYNGVVNNVLETANSETLFGFRQNLALLSLATRKIFSAPYMSENFWLTCPKIFNFIQRRHKNYAFTKNSLKS